MPVRLFVTGTDTDVGKTFVSSVLISAVNQRGLKTAALKPVAAGATQTTAGLRNEDALILQKAISEPITYEDINPVCLPEAIAPHIAAKNVNYPITVESLVVQSESALCSQADFTVVEGAGGWRVPLNDKETLADYAQALGFPVVLVVGLRLGCLNHALLTAEAIRRDGLRLAGWIANHIDPDMPVYQENIETLKSSLLCPYLGYIPFLHKPCDIHAKNYVDIDQLLN